MSKGSPIMQTRIPASLLKEVDAIIARMNVNRYEEPVTRSTFTRDALREKVAKMERSRRARGKGRVEGDGAALAEASAPVPSSPPASAPVNDTLPNVAQFAIVTAPDGSECNHDITDEASSRELPQVAG